jgi:hypothetical protein
MNPEQPTKEPVKQETEPAVVCPHCHKGFKAKLSHVLTAVVGVGLGVIGAAGGSVSDD